MIGRTTLSLAILGLAAPSLAQEALHPYEVVGNAIPKSLTGAPGDAERGRAIVVKRESTCLLCHSGPFPEQRFQGDPRVLGRTLEIDTWRGGKFTIIGVMPQNFEFPAGAKIWISLGDWGGGPMPGQDAAERCCSWYTTFARLKPGVTAEQAEAELTIIARRISPMPMI